MQAGVSTAGGVVVAVGRKRDNTELDATRSHDKTRYCRVARPSPAPALLCSNRRPSGLEHIPRYYSQIVSHFRV